MEGKNMIKVLFCFKFLIHLRRRYDISYQSSRQKLQMLFSTKGSNRVASLKQWNV